MYKIKLINMPFASVDISSLALTQLKAVLERQHADKVSCEILYLNQDTALHLGLREYKRITDLEGSNSGLGDWLFRQHAFPEAPDNGEKYFRRYLPYKNESAQRFKNYILEQRAELGQFLDSLIDRYKLEMADLVGFTSMFNQNVASFALAKKIKERNPDVITVMGGANCESPMGQEIARNVKQIDFVFSGPALKNFPEFVGYCVDKEPAKGHQIKGVFSKRSVGLAGCASSGEELSLDELFDLNYDSFLRDYRKNFSDTKTKPLLLFETSRGCWWGERAHCTFCGLNGQTMSYRAMSPEKAIDQYNSLFKYSEECSVFQCVDNILPKNYLSEVFPHLKTPDNSIIFYEVKADLSENDMKVLSEARVKRIQPGIETLSTATLKLMKKGTSAFTNIALLKYCVTYGVVPVWNILLGSPGEKDETYESYLKNIPLLTHLPPPNSTYPIRFDRYSPYHMRPQEWGLDLHPMDFYSLIYPFSEESLRNLAYYFSDGNLCADYRLTLGNWFNRVRERVVYWFERWLNRGQLPLPELYFIGSGNSTVIYDSRHGKAVEYPISSTTRSILDWLDTPRHVTNSTLPNEIADGVDVEREMAFLKEQGFVFQEGDRYMNLVLQKRAPVQDVVSSLAGIYDR